MELFASENLILIEFLVDKICFEHSTSKELEKVDGETCVSFQFFDNAPICICEEDFVPKCPADMTFVKSGKSCLFSLSAEQGEAALEQFEVYVAVYKKFRDGGESDRLHIGEALISVADSFADLMKSVSLGDTCCTKTMKDFFMLYSKTGEFIGSIGVYIRLSSFGRQVVTQFQMNVKNKSVEFKANRGHYLFKYCKTGKSDKQVCLLPTDSKRPPVGNSCPTIATTQGFSGCNMISDSARSRSVQLPGACCCSSPPTNRLSTCCSVPTSSGQSACPPPSRQSVCPPPSRQSVCPPPIRQPACPPPTRQFVCSPCRPPVCCRCSPQPPYKLCFAENTNENSMEGSYQEIETQMGDCGGIKVRLHEDPEEKKECVCIKPPDSVEKELVVPPCGGVCVMSPSCKSGGGKDHEAVDSEEMYVLRVGTRRESMSMKNNVDLEFCTPIPRCKPPPPIIDTKNMQYDPADCKEGKGGKKQENAKGKKK